LKLNKVLTMVLMMVSVVLLAACGSDEPSNDPVAYVNDEAIMENELDEQVDRMKSSYEQQGIDFNSEQGEQFLPMIKEQAMQTLIQQAVIYQAAEAAGFAADDALVESELDQIKAQFDSEEDFEEILAFSGFTIDSFKETLRLELTIESYFEAQLEDVDITEEALEDYYDEYVEYMEENDEEVEDFDEVKDDLEAQLIEMEENEQINTLVDQLMDDSDIDILDED